MVSGLRAATYEDKLAELDLFTLEERRHQMDMLQVYKILHGKDKCAPLFTKMSDSERTTRAAAGEWNLRVPFARLEIRKNFFTVRTPALWNEIPAGIKNATNPEQFKMKYRQHRRMRLGDAQN